MPEQDADLLKVMIGQIAEHREINSVLSKALRVLPETELLKPIRDLLHRGSAPDYRAYAPASASLPDKPAQQ
jgi:hypothetical protein